MRNLMLGVCCALLSIPLYGQTVVTIGSTNSTDNDSDIPFDANWEYSWSRAVYYGSEINVNGEITGLAYYLDDFAGPYTTTRSLRIYFRETSISGYTTSTDDHPGLNGFTKVYDGNFVVNNEELKWKNITLSTPFKYDKRRNLEILVEDRTGAYHTDYPYFTSIYSTSPYRGAQDDASTNNIFGQGSAGLYSTYIPIIRLQIDECAVVPNISVTSTPMCNGDTARVEANPTNGTGTYTFLWSTGATTSFIDVDPNITTNYEVTVTDQNGAGCCSWEDADVEIHYESPTATASKYAVCKGTETTILNIPNPGGSIQWQDSTPGQSWASATGGSGAFSSSYTTPTLSDDRWFRARINNACGVSFSNVIKINTHWCMRNVTATNCKDTIYDSGGRNGAYGNDEDLTFVISPPGATGFDLTFFSFAVEDSVPLVAPVDYLDIHDGTTTSDPRIGRYYGNTSPGTVTSTSGSLTLHFVSNPITTMSGWGAAWDISTPTSVSLSANKTSICAGDSILFTATPTNGGTPTYQWKVNGGNISNAGPTFNAKNLADNDIVTVEMTSSLACADPVISASNAIQVDIDPVLAPTVSISTPNTTICAGTTPTFTATPVNAGGSPSYDWFVNGTSMGVNQSTYAPGNLKSGDVVTAAVYSSLPCASPTADTSTGITITINPLVLPTVNVTSTSTATCAPFITFTANPTNGGGSPSYQWKRNGGNVGPNLNQYTAAGLNAGDEIWVVMTSSDPCASPLTATSNKITIVSNPVASVTLTTTADTICAGGSVTYGTVPINGGGSPAYNWFINGNLAGPNSPTFTPGSISDSALVHVTMNTSDPCAQPTTAPSDTLRIRVLPLQSPSISITATKTTICPGESVTFNANIAQGGNNPSFQWKRNNTAVGTNSPFYINNTLKDGDQVICVLSSDFQCASPPSATSTPITMTVLKQVAPTVSIAVAANPICAPDTAIFTASGTDTGAAPIYQWYVNNNPTGPNSRTFALPVVNNGDVIKVEMTSSADCPVPTSVVSSDIIMQHFPMPLARAGLDRSICEGNSTIIGDNPTVSGGTGPYQFEWSPTLDLNFSNIARPTATPKGTIGYNLTVTDANDCKSEDEVEVEVIPNTLVANGGGDQAKCFGQDLFLGASPTASGGQSPYTYNWAPGTGLNNTTASNPKATPTVTTTYTLTIEDFKGCVRRDTVTITPSPTPSAFAGPDKGGCEGVGLMIGDNPAATGGTGPYTYLWSPATGLDFDTVPQPIATPSQSQSYLLKVTDVNGCTATDAVSITITPAPDVDAGPDRVNCTGSPSVIGGSPTISSGVSPFTLAWTPSQGLSSTTAHNPIANPANTTLYYLAVTDQTGCTGRDTVEVTVSQGPIVNAGPDRNVCGNNTIGIGGTPTATGVSPFTYDWQPIFGLAGFNSANPGASPGKDMTYTVTVTDVNGCENSDSMKLFIVPSPSVSPGSFQKVCDGDQVILGGNPTATGGASPYNYSWLPVAGLNSASAAKPIATVTTTMTYTLTVTDANGCEKVDSVMVDTFPELIVDAGPVIFACERDVVMLGGSPTATGGDQPITYVWTPQADLDSSLVANPMYTVTGSQLFSLDVEDSNGCRGNGQQQVTMFPTPTADFSFGVNNFHVTFSDHSTNTAGNWFWTFGDGNTSTQQNPSHTYASKGAYQVCLYVETANCEDSICQQVQAGEVNAVVHLDGAVVEAFPNPTDDAVTIRSIGAMTTKTHLVLMDMNGRLVQDLGQWNGTPRLLDMSSLAAGTYTLRGTDQSTQWQLRLIRL